MKYFVKKCVDRKRILIWMCVATMKDRKGNVFIYEQYNFDRE